MTCNLNSAHTSAVTGHPSIKPTKRISCVMLNYNLYGSEFMWLFQLASNS